MSFDINVGVFVTQSTKNGKRISRVGLRGSWGQEEIGRVKKEMMAREPDCYIFVNDATDAALRKEGF